MTHSPYFIRSSHSSRAPVQQVALVRIQCDECICWRNLYCTMYNVHVLYMYMHVGSWCAWPRYRLAAASSTSATIWNCMYHFLQFNYCAQWTYSLNFLWYTAYDYLSAQLVDCHTVPDQLFYFFLVTLPVTFNDRNVRGVVAQMQTAISTHRAVII